MLEVSFTPFPTLESERLVLRRITEGDLQALLFLRSDPEMMRFIDRKPATCLEDVRGLLVKIETSLANDAGITWAIALKPHPRQMIGTVGFWRIDKEHHRAEIGYALHHGQQGQGLMAEALETVLDFGFEKLRLHSVEGNINTSNVASAKVLERAGFVQEAHFRENYYYDGKFLDSIIYSKLAPAQLKNPRATSRNVAQDRSDSD